MPPALSTSTLPRGGHLVHTSAGPIQFGVPPETIKDTLPSPSGVPRVFVLTRSFFCYRRGVTLAEVEFPIFYNYFGHGRRPTIVCAADQRHRLRALMREALLGPQHIDLTRELTGAPPWRADLPAEMAWFRRDASAPTRARVLDDFVEIVVFVADEVDLGAVLIRRVGGEFEVVDRGAGDASARVPDRVDLPSPAVSRATRPRPFHPPVLGVTVLGSGHGFDPAGRTTGFILWVHGRGILVDPPVDTTAWLDVRGIPARAIDSVLLTHCHADHDGGTLQKALQAERTALYTTETIFGSFLRKAEAVTALPREHFDTILDFRPVPIGRPFHIHGARFLFHYTLHPIPCIRFEVWAGGKSLVYSSDTLNHPPTIQALADAGVLSAARRDHLLDFPWHHDCVIHEAGVPPIHTPLEVLAALPDETKGRLHVVHTTASAIDSESGLRLAAEGLTSTIRLGARPHPAHRGIAWLRAMEGVEPFASLPSHAAATFLGLVKPRTYAAGETVIHAGDHGDLFFMILSGVAAVERGEVPLKHLGMYDYFGEAALLLDTRRTADVTALTDLEVLTLSREAFLDFVAGTGIADELRRLYANRSRGTWGLIDRHPQLSSLDHTQRTRLQAAMVLRRFGPGTTLPAASAAWLVRSGHVSVAGGRGEPEVLGRGELAADLGAAFDGRPATLAFRAIDDVAAFEVPADAWRRFLLDYPGLYLRLAHPED